MSLRIKDGNIEIEILFDHIVYEEIEKRLIDLYGKGVKIGVDIAPIGTKCTLATVKLNGQPQMTSTAFCSQKDNFCKSTGRKIALSRAIKMAKEHRIIDKNTSKIIWDEYRRNCK